MKAALRGVGERLGRDYPLVDRRTRIETEKKIRSLNPADPARSSV